MIETGRVLGERRLRTLRDLANTAADARTVAEACAAAAASFDANPQDLPFALIYLLDADAAGATLAGAAGLVPGTPSCPRHIRFAEAAIAPWPLAEVARTGRRLALSDVGERLGALPGRAGPEPVREAVVLPLARHGGGAPAGLLVAGVSPRLVLDEGYWDFFGLLAGGTATALANARASETQLRRAESLAGVDRAKTRFSNAGQSPAPGPLGEMLGGGTPGTADRALRESEARYHALFAASPVPLMVLAADPPDFTITAANDAYLAATLTTRAGLIGRRLFDTFTDDPARPGPNGSAALAASLDRVLTTRQTDAMPRTRYDLAIPGGFAPHWWLAINAPMLDGVGQVSAIIHQVTRVTELHLAEEAERAIQEQLRQFGEASQDVLWIRDADTLQWSYLSPAFEAIYGLSREEALSGDNYRNWQDLILPEDRADAVENIRRVAQGEPVVFEYRVRRPVDGEIRWLRDTDFPMRDADGRVQRIGGVGHDATGLKRIEAALRHSESRLRVLMEGVPQLIWRASDNGLWTWSSPQWLDYTGQLQAESHGWGWLDAVHPDDHAAATRGWDAAHAHGWLDVEYRVRHAGDGAWRWHQTRSVPLRGAAGPGQPEGRILEWLGTTTDIEDLKRLHDQQHVLVAELQHRTRNLLSVVRNVARRSIVASAMRDEYDARLAALGRVQGFLSRTALYTVPLADLIEAELHAAGNGGSGKAIIAGPPVDLPGESVQAVALALHELATNAVKYGAIAQEAARLSVTWHIQPATGSGSARLIIDWRESGVAMQGGPPTRRGYGSELITKALPYQLQAETLLEFKEDGVRCRIALPASAFGAGMAEEQT